MIFSSYKFIFVFLPIVYIAYSILNQLKSSLYAKAWLVGASFYFYAQGSRSFFPFFAGSVGFNFIIGYLIGKQKGKHTKLMQKALLAIGLAENIVLLGYFKYRNFLVVNYNYLTKFEIPMKTIILPIGISFFTFQLIAYLIDSYRGYTKDYSFLNYLLFITFFPQLIVGPIVHHKDVVPQFEDKERRFFNLDNFILGIFIFSLGCSKKILLADPLTNFAQPYFNNPSGGFWFGWFSALAYTISYYFDLSGYADMAIGLGLLFNIKLPQNFNSPYKAKDFQEYWRRWHITLSNFLSQYIFRSIFKKGDRAFKYYLAIMITFLVSGIWHGAGWSFVIWGIINGIFVCISSYMNRKEIKLPGGFAWLLTFVGVVATRIIFVSASVGNTIKVFKQLMDIGEFKGNHITHVALELRAFLGENYYSLIILALAMAIVFFGKNTNDIMKDFKPKLKYAAVAGALLGLSILQMGQVTKFLYFQF